MPNSGCDVVSEDTPLLDRTGKNPYNPGMQNPPQKSEVTHESLRQAPGNAVLEGLYPDSETLADLETMTLGKLTGDDYRKRLKARYGNP